MTSINTSSLNAYSSAFTVAIKQQDDKANEAQSSDSSGRTTVAVDMSGAQVEQASAGSGAPSTDKLIAQIKKQIEETQKQLEQQRAQLAAVQNGKLDEQSKAQQVAALQAQIAQTSATLQTLQGSLLQLLTDSIKGGNVDTTA